MAGETKLVGVNLAALTRVQWYGNVEVPKDMDPDEVVEKMNDEIDGGEYVDDVDYWEKGHCYPEVELAEDATPEFKIDEDGKLLMLTLVTPDEPEVEDAELCVEEVGQVNISLNATEAARANKFMSEHRVADRNSLGMTRIQFSFTVTPSTVGEMFMITDRVTGDSEDITDTEKF